MMVLSGMGNMDMMNDNLSYMKEFEPLNEKEQVAVAKVCKIFKSLGTIQCTACRYCMEVCPQHLEIRELLERVAEVFEKKE